MNNSIALGILNTELYLLDKMNTSFMWLVLFACFLQLCAGQDLRTQFLNPHNDTRSRVGAGPLVWDDTVAAYAQNYAKQRRGDCAPQHSGGPYGENIFKESGVEFTPADAVNSWVNEKQYYDYNSNTCAQGYECGHYTQVVWKNVTTVPFSSPAITIHLGMLLGRSPTDSMPLLLSPF